VRPRQSFRTYFVVVIHRLKRGFGQMYQGDLAKLNVKLNVINLESAAFLRIR